MRIHSDSFENGKPIPAEFAMGQADGFGGNRNPHLAWDEVPQGTRSFALLCIDPDAPTVPETVGRDDLQIPVEQPRGRFHPLGDGRYRRRHARDRSGQLQRRHHRQGQAEPAGSAGRAPGLERLHRLVRRRCGHGRRLLRLRRPVPAVQRPAHASLLLPAVRAGRGEARPAGAVHRRARCCARCTAMCWAKRSVHGTYSLNAKARPTRAGRLWDAARPCGLRYGFTVSDSTTMSST